MEISLILEAFSQIRCFNAWFSYGWRFSFFLFFSFIKKYEFQNKYNLHLKATSISCI